MRASVKAMYKKATKDTAFIAAIKEADQDTPPGVFASDLEKSVFAAVYYGYRVAKCGVNWR